MEPWIGDRDKETINRALAELRKRGVHNICPRCGQHAWLAELVAFHVSELPKAGRSPVLGAYIPALSMTCENCGCVHIHNLINLGVTP
jgi:uncharacterized Zn finger protein